jgi:hypothetical protein
MMISFQEFIVLAVIFIVGNVLDSYSTYMCLFKLPASSRGQELNPIAAPGITTHFRRQMGWKAVGTLLVIFLTMLQVPNRSLSIMSLLDVLMAFVVANNAYVYLTRRGGKNVLSPGQLVQNTLHIPVGIAFILLITVYALLSFLLVWGAGLWRY